MKDGQLRKNLNGAYKTTTQKIQDVVNRDEMGNKPMLDFYNNVGNGAGVMHNDLGSDTSIGNTPVKNTMGYGSPGEDLGMIGNLPPANKKIPKQGKSDVTNVVRK